MSARALTRIGRDPNESSCANRSRSGSWLDSLDWLDFSDGFDLEGCIPALLIGIVLALVGLLFFAIFSASALIAEVFLDAFIITVLYRHLRVAAQENWLGTAVRKTWWPALLTAALLRLAGWGLQALAPGAHSIGPPSNRSSVRKIRPSLDQSGITRHCSVPPAHRACSSVG